MWILPIIVFLSFKAVDCGGNVEVRLLNYDYLASGNTTRLCCDVKSTGCDTCDPVFEISLAELKGSSLAIINSSQTTQFNNTNHIDFGLMPGAAGGHFFFDFIKFSSKYYLAFKILDRNITILDDLRFLVGQGEPSSFKTRTNFTVRTVAGNNTEIKFEYIIKCKTYYYGYCQVYCKPVPKQYTCDSNGRKVCEPGWSGPNCTIYQTGPSCKTTLCQNGATCVETAINTSTCFCSPFFTGRLCEIKLGSSSFTPMSVSVTPGMSFYTTTGLPNSQQSNMSFSRPVAPTTSIIRRTTQPNVTRQTHTQSTPHVSQHSTRLVLPAVTLSIDQITFELDTVKPDSAPDLTGIIVGSILGFLLLTVLVTITVFICKKK